MERKEFILLILCVNLRLMTKDQEKPLRKVSALQLLVEEEHWPFLGCPHFSQLCFASLVLARV